jgi:hypothetical protein
MESIAFPSLREFVASASDGASPSALGVNVKVDTRATNDLTWCSSVLNIQALLNAASTAKGVRFVWDRATWDHFTSSPNTFPLLAAALAMSNSRHVIAGEMEPPSVRPVIAAIAKHKLRFDWFSAPQSLLCADHLGIGRPIDLYPLSQSSGIRPRQDFEQLVFPFIERQLAVDLDKKLAYKWREALASVIYELFENTDLHGKTDLQGKLLSPSVRGIIFREIPLERYQPTPKAPAARARCVEIGIFDYGLGYFERSQRRPIASSTPLQEEWEVLHSCLSTHLDDTVESPPDRGLHGIGLYEVLRALKFLTGAIEIRTGRLHGYRSFLPGDLPLQMEPSDSRERPNMPKPTFLDFKHKYLKRPTPHPLLRGTAVRVLVPLL